jgi:hypothetical protein
MGSGLFLFELLREHEPTLRGGRFMESGLFLFELLRGHEPRFGMFSVLLKIACWCIFTPVEKHIPHSDSKPLLAIWCRGAKFFSCGFVRQSQPCAATVR